MRKEPDHFLNIIFLMTMVLVEKNLIEKEFKTRYYLIFNQFYSFDNFNSLKQIF